MARRNPEKLWLGGGIAAAVVLTAGLWLFAVHPQLSNASSLRSQVSDAQWQNSILQNKVNTLKAAYDHIGPVRSALARARAALPSGNGLAALSWQIQRQASAAHVSVTSLTAGTPAAATSAVAPTAATAAASTSAAPAPVTAAQPATAYTIPMTVVVAGTAAQDLAFLHAVQQHGPRAALVTDTQLTDGDAGTGSNLTVQMTVFVAPPITPAAPPAAAASADPTPAPTATQAAAAAP
jgi:hypothetical protein